MTEVEPREAGIGVGKRSEEHVGGDVRSGEVEFDERGGVSEEGRQSLDRQSLKALIISQPLIHRPLLVEMSLWAEIDLFEREGFDEEVGIRLRRGGPEEGSLVSAETELGEVGQVESGREVFRLTLGRGGLEVDGGVGANLLEAELFERSGAFRKETVEVADLRVAW